MIKLEKDIEQKLRKMVEAHGGRCLKWVCPGWVGVPDRIVLLPMGRIIFAEVKRPRGGVLSPMQKKWRQWLTKLGFTCEVVWNNEDLLSFKVKHLEERRSK